MNKENIVDKTMRLFLRDGIRKISMDDIAEYAMVSKVTIYKYFADKDTLYLEIGRRILRDSIAKLESIDASADTLVKRLYGFLETVSAFTDSGRHELCRELAKRNRGIEDEYELYGQAYKHTLLRLIDEGLRDGVIRENLDRDMAFHYIDMGVYYYSHNTEYRYKMNAGGGFQQRFLSFYVCNVFADGDKILSAL